MVHIYFKQIQHIIFHYTTEAFYWLLKQENVYFSLFQNVIICKIRNIRAHFSFRMR